jgi:DNA-binding MarR family transcriptional regulator
MSEAGDCDLPAGLRADLGWLLGQVVQAYALAAGRVLGEFPGGGRGYLTLVAAVGQSARNQVELARQLGIDRTVMVYLLDDLVKAGLVERRLDPADRRNRLIVATEAGRARQAALGHVLHGTIEEFLAPLTGDERAAFEVTLHRLIEHNLGPAVPVEACELADHVVAHPTAAAPGAETRRG